MVYSLCRGQEWNISQSIPGRAEVVADASAALSVIRDGCVVGVGGALTAGHPMALVRQLIRSGARDLTIVSPTAGLDVDLLIACGRVRKVVCAYLGAEGVAPVGPAFRAAVQGGEVEFWEGDEAHCVLALRAAAQGLPFLPWRGGVGTDIGNINPELVTFRDPIRGETLLAVPARPLDVALIAAERADPYGNVQFAGVPYLDRLLADASRHVVVQVERVVANEAIRQTRADTVFWNSTTIVLAPWGTHPFSAWALDADTEHLRHYVAAVNAKAKRNYPAPLQAYLDRYVTSPRTHADYLEAVGIRRIMELMA